MLMLLSGGFHSLSSELIELPEHLDIIVADDDPKMCIALHYLFTIVCRKKARFVDTFAKASTLLMAGNSLSVLIVGDSSKGEPRSQIIKKAAELRYVSFILVIDRNRSSEERICAYKAGANDIIRTPFSLLEIQLHMRAKLNALTTGFQGSTTLVKKDWDTEAFIVNFAGLTVAEAQVAHILIERRGTIVSRDDLSQAINGRPWSFGDRKYDVHISKLRKKLEKSFGDRCRVSTVHSVGYILNMDETPLPLEAPNVGELHVVA